MEIFNRCIEIVDVNLIYCFPWLILTLSIIELLFKNKFETKKALNIVRWFIIFYTTVTLAFFIIGIIVSPEEFAFTNRATGPYWLTYWLMLLSATLLPFSLLIKRLAKNFFYVFLISFFIKIGFYFERFVIVVTSLHRDYSPNNENSYFLDFFSFPGIFLLQGFIIAVIILLFLEVSTKIKLRSTRINDKNNCV